VEEAMLRLHPEYAVDDQDKRKAVVLPVEEWEQIIDELEELEDIRLYDKAKQEAGEAVSFEQAIKEIDRDNGK
jgi:PHD/YefM family antitoxin component YafN of YafNO toxin-antitoxin module